MLALVTMNDLYDLRSIYRCESDAKTDQTDDMSYASSSMNDLIVDFGHRRRSYIDINKTCTEPEEKALIEPEDASMRISEPKDVIVWFVKFVRNVCREMKRSKSKKSQGQVEVKISIADKYIPDDYSEVGSECTLMEYFYFDYRADSDRSLEDSI